MRCFLKNREQKTSILVSTFFSRGKRNDLKKALSRLWRSKKGMAIPVTFLILFVSLSLVVSITYYFAVSKINSKSQLLKASAAKQSMLYLEDTIASVAWSPGSSQIYSFDNYGGRLRVEPEAKSLLINITDNDAFSDIVFNSSVGDAAYELPPAESLDDNLYMKGDSRVVINQSRSTMSQLYISQGTEYREITLYYRPLASSTETGSNGGKPVNVIRIYIMNLNSSQNTTFDGNFHLEITSLNVTSSSRSYNFTSQINSLLVKVIFDGVSGEVSLPVSSSAQGALVNVEIVTSDIRLRSVGV